MPPFGPNRTPPTDETFQPGEAMTQVKSEADLAPGVVIRVWHEQLNRWIPGWWLEVLEVKGGRVYLRDLQSQERNDRSLRDTLGVAWIHPQPARVSSLGTARAAAEASRLAELRAGYARMDLEQATQTEMTATLHQELQWLQSHMDRRYDMKQDFAVHEEVIARIGEELNGRGGMRLMREVGATLGSPRLLDTSWDGIGDWRG